MAEKTHMVIIKTEPFPNPRSLYLVELYKRHQVKRYRVTEQRAKQVQAAADFEPVIDGGAIYLVGWRKPGHTKE